MIKLLSLKARLIIVAVVLVIVILFTVIVAVGLLFASSSVAQASECVPLNPGPAAPGPARGDQIANAKKIDETAKELGISGKGTRIAIITALGESSLININYGDGAVNPDGSIADSIGLFQQQGSWGTVAQRMDVKYATQSFFTGPKHDRKGGLLSIAGWEQMEPTIAIHKVQINADPNHYARYYTQADQIIEAAKIDIDRAGTSGGGSNAGGDDTCETAGNGKPGTGPKKPGDDYPWSGTRESAGFSPLRYVYGNCTDFTAWRINRDAGVTKAPWKWNWGNLTPGDGNAKNWGNQWAARGWKQSKTPKPGDTAVWTNGEFGHVAYVQAVNADGTITVEEYNWLVNGAPDNSYHTRTIPASDAETYLSPPKG